MKTSGSEPMFDSVKWPVVGNNCYDYAFGDKKKYRAMKSEPGVKSHTNSYSTFRTCGRGVQSMNYKILSDNPRTVYKLRNIDEPCKKGYYKVMSFVAANNIVGEPYGDFHFYKQVGKVRYRLGMTDTVKSLAKFFRVNEYVIKEALKNVKRPKSMNNGDIDSPGNKTSSRIHSEHIGKIIEFPVNLWAHKLGWGTPPILVDASGKTIYDPRKANRKYDFNYTTLCGGYCVRRRNSIAS
jgi:hypothetical protein